MLERVFVAIGIAALSGCGTLENRNGADRLSAAEVTDDASLAVWQDQQARDLQLLAQKNPALARRPVTKRMGVFTGYAVSK